MKFDQLRSAVMPLLRDHVDTDQIIPARFLKTVDREGLGDKLFAEWKKEADFVLNQPQFRGAQILLAGKNFGCGSSREHAPWALLAWGFRVVIAGSFADIFRNNALRNGLLTVEPAPEDYLRIVALVKSTPDCVLEVDLHANVVRLPSEEVPFAVDAFARDCLLRGVDRLDYLLDYLPEIEAYEASRAG